VGGGDQPIGSRKLNFYNQGALVFEEIDKKIIGVVERLSAVSPLVVSASNCR